TLLQSESRETLEAIVDRLDGIPLAIELCVARLGVFSPAELLSRLTRQLATLTRGPRDASHHRATLRGALEWSYGLLAEHEKEAFAQLSVFRGGFTLEAAEAVVDLSAHPEAPPALDVVASLRDKSLLRAVPAAGARRL